MAADAHLDAVFDPQLCLQEPEYPQKEVTLQYVTHHLQGKLYLVPGERFIDLHCRFFDISPPQLRLDDKHCEPWVLFHGVMDKTWAPAGDIPGATLQSARDEVQKPKEPSFVAVTDNAELWEGASKVGVIDINGKLMWVLSTSELRNDLIIALPCHRPFSGYHEIQPRYITPRFKSKTRPALHYPPAAIAQAHLDTVRTLMSASKEPRNSNAGVPKLGWVDENLPGLLSGRGLLAKSHPLYAHRGNEALLPRHVWLGICWKFGMSRTQRADADGKIPEPYYQVLFPDLQERKRVEGTEWLKCGDEKWYESREEMDLSVFEQAEEANGDVEIAGAEEKGVS